MELEFAGQDLDAQPPTPPLLREISFWRSRLDGALNPKPVEGCAGVGRSIVPLK